MRVNEHPILDFDEQVKLTFQYDGKQVYGYTGDTIASALHALGIRKLSSSVKHKRPRGFYCAIGNCASCNMIVDGIANVRTCITELKEGMIVQTQKNKGVINESS